MELQNYKNDAKKAASELRYQFVMPDIFRRINAAKSESEICRIMTTARHLL